MRVDAMARYVGVVYANGVSDFVHEDTLEV